MCVDPHEPPSSPMMLHIKNKPNSAVFFSLYVSMYVHVCACVSLCAPHVCRSSGEATEFISSLEAGVTNGWEPSGRALRITAIHCKAAMAFNYPAISPVLSLMVLVPKIYKFLLFKGHKLGKVVIGRDKGERVTKSMCSLGKHQENGLKLFLNSFITEFSRFGNYAVFIRDISF